VLYKLEETLGALLDLQEQDDDFAVCLDRSLSITLPFLELVRRSYVDKSSAASSEDIAAVQRGLHRIERLRWAGHYNADNAQRATAIALRQMANVMLSLRDELEDTRHISSWRSAL
jgi:hypothetical protein